MCTELSSQLKKDTEQQFMADWERQRKTAAEILRRFQNQEGVILADQVGMGKTYVALAVAVSEILSTPTLGQVVVFVPAAVGSKWINEWRKFKDTLVDSDAEISCVEEPIRSGEGFLKALEEEKNLIIVTHQALTSSLKDGYIQLALLYYAIKGVHGVDKLRRRIAKWSDGRRGLIANSQFTRERVTALLKTPPKKWREVWLKCTNQELSDPVPAALEEAVSGVDFSDLRDVINTLPEKNSAHIEQRLKNARKALAEETQAAWRLLLSSTNLNLPLLIVDEAHRLKNSNTQISKLFASCTEEEGEEEKEGVFYGAFRRMLFLTATPFELGHKELINVLSRFNAVSQPVSPSLVDSRLQKLESTLLHAQSSALAFNEAWGRLTPSDLYAFDAWEPKASVPDHLDSAVAVAWGHANLVVQTRQEMYKHLKTWVIRHERPRRRRYFPGAAIAKGKDSEGLEISEEAALPFLLAARAQTLVLDDGEGARPPFAYGIASSYQAFCRLDSPTEGDGRDSEAGGETKAQVKTLFSPSVARSTSWYRQEIKEIVRDKAVLHAHPKVKATVDKAVELWVRGEKCLIFNWFIRSGEAVTEALSARINALVNDRVKAALQDENAKLMLDRLSDRLFRSDSSSYARIRQLLSDALRTAARGNEGVLNLVVDAGIRHLRTPSYLVRYTHLGPSLSEEQLWRGIQGDNPCGVNLLERWQLFTQRLANAGADHGSEFLRIRAALLGEEEEGTRGAKLEAVRRASGETKRQVRERLIALFNTPFTPEILVASSVMGEGIDLHQECRVVIHHDLDWNPSVLEQRTGRLDRIGALAERIGQNIDIYEPYLAGTHDEKMYKVVKDRAQWFDIVMGAAASSDEQATDIEENRVPLHQKIKDALVIDLSSGPRGSNAHGSEGALEPHA